MSYNNTESDAMTPDNTSSNQSSAAHMLLDVPSRLETERLILKPYKPGDGQWLYAMYRENSVHLSESIEGIKSGFGLDLTNPDEAETFVRQLVSDWAAHRRFIYSVWEKDTENYVGDIWIECIDWDIPMHEIGYLLVKDHVGKGFATEGTKAALGMVFNCLKANKASLTCGKDNIPSYRVAERCGFIREGCLRAEIRRKDGTLIDKFYYGMLKTEFEALTS